jgi:flagellar protein FliS
MSYSAPKKPRVPVPAAPGAIEPSHAEAVTASQRRARLVHEHYRKAQIETATPAQLILMLYDGAIRFCTLGKEAMLAKRLEEQNTNLVKAQRIIGELTGSLNQEVGGEIARNLFSLYLYMLQELVKANLYANPEPIDMVVAQLSELRDSWREAERITTRSGADHNAVAGRQPGGAPALPATAAGVSAAPNQIDPVPPRPAIAASPNGQRTGPAGPAPLRPATVASPNGQMPPGPANPIRPAPQRRVPEPAAQPSPSTRLGECDA